MRTPLHGVFLDHDTLSFDGDVDLAPLRAVLDGLEVHGTTPPAALTARIAAAEVVFTNKCALDAAALAAAPALKLICLAIEEEPLKQGRHIGAQLPRRRIGCEAICGNAHGRKRFAPAAEFRICIAKHANDREFGGIAAPAEPQGFQKLNRVVRGHHAGGAANTDRFHLRAHCGFLVARAG